MTAATSISSVHTIYFSYTSSHNPILVSSRPANYFRYSYSKLPVVPSRPNLLEPLIFCSFPSHTPTSGPTLDIPLMVYSNHSLPSFPMVFHHPSSPSHPPSHPWLRAQIPPDQISLLTILPLVPSLLPRGRTLLLGIYVNN